MRKNDKFEKLYEDSFCSLKVRRCWFWFVNCIFKPKSAQFYNNERSEHRLFLSLFFPHFFICADKDAHENSSFYYINPHEFQSCASLSAQIKKEGKWRISKNWTKTRTVPLHFHKLSKSSNWWLAINDRMTNHLSRFLTTLFLPRASLRAAAKSSFVDLEWAMGSLWLPPT